MSRLTRRGFLNKSLVAAGAAGAIGSVAQGGPSAVVRKMSTSILGANDRVRLGAIGVGGQGRHDIMTFFKHDKSIEVPAIPRHDLEPGERVVGPAIIEDFGATVHVHRGQALKCLPSGILEIEIDHGKG